MKNKYPQTPEQWQDANYTAFRKFDFTSTPDIEALIRLVKENIPNTGNSAYLRHRLLGILWSKFSYANDLFWTQHKYPHTYKIRLFIKKITRIYHLNAKSKYYKKQVRLSNMSFEIIKELNLNK